MVTEAKQVSEKAPREPVCKMQGDVRMRSKFFNQKKTRNTKQLLILHRLKLGFNLSLFVLKSNGDSKRKLKGSRTRSRENKNWKRNIRGGTIFISTFLFQINHRQLLTHFLVMKNNPHFVCSYYISLWSLSWEAKHQKWRSVNPRLSRNKTRESTSEQLRASALSRDPGRISSLKSSHFVVRVKGVFFQWRGKVM